MDGALEVRNLGRLSAKAGPFGDRPLRPPPPPPPPPPPWYWQWGAPLTAGLGLLAAGALVAVASWDLAEAARIVQPGDAALAAAVFAAALLLFWRVARVDAKSLDDDWSGTRGEIVVAALVASAGVVLAAYYLDLPLQDDETATMIQATRPLAATASEYASTNTHMLHTLLVWVAHRIAEWDRIAARAPAFLSFSVLLPLLWRFTRREYGPTAALFALVFGAASPYFVQYATNARGYTLMLVLFASALLCGQALVRTPERRAPWALWAATIGLGFFALPIMVFPAAVAVTWMVLARWRRCGRKELRPFVAKTAAWSSAALAIAGALYAPVIAMEGPRDVLDALSHAYRTLNRGLNTDTRALMLLPMPAYLWRDWYEAFPTWAHGALLALTVVGAAVPGRSCGRSGTLFLALVVPTAALLTLMLFPLPPRMAIWALLVCVVLAGAGAGFLLEHALAWAGSRWPGVVAGPRPVALRYGVAALCFAVIALVVVPRQLTHHDRRAWPGLLAMTSSVAATALPGDSFVACGTVRARAMVYMHGLYSVEQKTEWWEPVPGQRGPVRSSVLVHHLRGFAADPAPGVSSSPPAAPGGGGGGRLYFFESLTRAGPRCRPEEVLMSSILEATWPRHETVAAFDTGRVYALDDWRGRLR